MDQPYVLLLSGTAARILFPAPLGPPRGGNTRLEGHPGVLALERVTQTPAGDPSGRSWL